MKNCVCVPMPTHCTITRFGFRARRIDGFKCGLFSNHATLGQTTLRVGRMCVTKMNNLDEKLCVCANANPLHYYALRVPPKADRWR